MDVKEALEFLKKHQPMPADRDLDKEVIGKYDEVRNLFLVYREPECVPLLLNSFGEREGLGVYQLVEDVITKYDNDEVVPHLKSALKSSFRSVRYWNAQIATYFPSIEIFEPLVELLDEDDIDIKYAVLTALAQFESNKVISIIKDFKEKETDLELQELAQEIINDIES